MDKIVMKPVVVRGLFRKPFVLCGELKSFIRREGLVQKGKSLGAKEIEIANGELKGVFVDPRSIRQFLLELPSYKEIQSASANISDYDTFHERIAMFNTASSALPQGTVLDLKGLDLSGKYLHEIEICNADLSGAKFEGADIGRAIFFNNIYSNQTNFKNAETFYTTFAGPVTKETFPNFKEMRCCEATPIFDYNWLRIMDMRDNSFNDSFLFSSGVRYSDIGSVQAARETRDMYFRMG